MPIEDPQIGGLLIVNGQIIGSVYEFYDADGDVEVSHFRLSSTDLKSAQAEGLFQVGTLGGGFVGGYMCPVPSIWQESIGKPYLTGQAALNIISRTSSGPGAFGFDPSDFDLTQVAAVPLVYYPINHQLGWNTHPLFNGTTRINGIFFPPESRSVLFFGSHGTGEIGYGEPAAFNDPVRSGKGFHSTDGKYAFLIWVYDASDFVKVRKGQVKPWELRPYDVWQIDFPQGPGSYELGGVSFDAKQRRLYVSQKSADRVGFDVNPLIHVFHLSENVTSKTSLSD